MIYITGDTHGEFGRIEDRLDYGKWYCGHYHTEQRVLSFDDLGYAKLNQPERPGIGYFKEAAGRETRRLLLPLYGKGETE